MVTHLAHVPLKALVVLEDLCSLLLAATELAGELINVCLCDLSVQVSIVFIEVIKVLSCQLLCISKLAGLVVDLPPAWQLSKLFNATT